MDNRKKGKTRRSYESDFKQELVRMLISGKSASELSETFGITENVGRHPGSLSLEKNGDDENKNKR
jgi:transposase-like protein